MGYLGDPEKVGPEKHDVMAGDGLTHCEPVKASGSSYHIKCVGDHLVIERTWSITRCNQSADKPGECECWTQKYKQTLHTGRDCPDGFHEHSTAAEVWDDWLILRWYEWIDGTDEGREWARRHKEDWQKYKGDHKKPADAPRLY